MTFAQTIITGKGNQIFLNLTLLPGGVTAEPVPFTITPSAPISANDTSFTPTAALAVGENLAVGSPITFPGGDSDIRQVLFSTSEVVGDGVTVPTINVRPAYVDIPVAAADVGPIRLLGGTNVERTFSSAVTDAIHHEDVAAYLVSSLISKDLEIPWTGDVVPGYPSYFLLQEILAQAEPTVWYELELTPPSGFSKGLITKNYSFISEYTDTWPADDKCIYSFTIKNQGSPTIVQPAL